tara:strand:+ start:418 stop:597 length:180 start_codon:yes stop_codon:yes gene_type:complete
MSNTPQYSEGIMSDGAAILQDGQRMPVEVIVSTLNGLTARVKELEKDLDEWNSRERIAS